HQFKPTKKWFANFMHRNGDVTEFDAVEGYERYLQGIKDVIFHTDDGRRLKAYKTELRSKHTSETIQNKLRDARNSGLDTVELEERIDNIIKDSKGNLPNYVTNIENYINVLTGKKAFGDRSMEQNIGRPVYSVLRAMEGRVAANMVGYLQQLVLELIKAEMSPMALGQLTA
ncbi:MAG: hypothetical protein RR954_09700, partial [Christensenellaceae bacterium]